MTTTPRAPTGLGLAGRRFWKETQAAFVIEDHMVPILTETCRCLDRLSEVREALEGQPLTIESPRGGSRRIRSWRRKPHSDGNSSRS